MLTLYGVVDILVNDDFKICFKTNKNSPVHWLQFRILHIILPVGFYLKINI